VRTSARLAAFAAALGLTFGAAALVGAAVDPVRDSDDQHGHETERSAGHEPAHGPSSATGRAVVLTAQASDAHMEALSTIRTDQATVQVMDIFSLEFGALLERPASPVQGGELDTSLLLYLAPELVRMELAQDFALAPQMLARYRPGHSRKLPAGSPGSVGFPSLASAQKGELLYRFILDRIGSCLVREA